MVLIVTASFDETATYLINTYPYFADDAFRLDVDRLGEYAISVDNEGWIIDSYDKKIRKQTTSSIYYRKPTLPDLKEYTQQYQYMIQRDIIALINGIVDDFEGAVVSKPSILRRTENKVFQLLYADKVDLRIPRSCIGNSCGRLEAINKERRLKDFIIKPLTTGVLRFGSESEAFHTNILREAEEDISLTPVYIQEYIEKAYEVRLTIIGENYYPVRIDTKNKIDWRKDYENHKYSLIECPKDVLSSCFKMLADFDLIFGTFDFVVNPDDDWFFLEMNPNGQWLWLEESMGLDISSKIVEALLGKDENGD